MRAWLRRWLLGGEIEELRECVRDLVELERTNGNGPADLYYAMHEALRVRLGMKRRN